MQGQATKAPSSSDALSTFVEELTARATAEVAPANKAQNDAEILQLKRRIEQAKRDLDAEKVMIVTRQAELDSQAFRLRMDQVSAQGIRNRRYQSRLPPVYEAMNLFGTPGAGASNNLEINRGGALGDGDDEATDVGLRLSTATI